ncbi:MULTISPECIES: hypothetical protein [Sphingobium]|uniref:Uncharacterized protein n=2 Tax=Sphingobium TaxID=165695 RepID=A0A9X7UH67_SPHYA|nr:hypothetical protein [Sphingobium yanoikuyae]QNG48724.1 hypothetical protein H3V42_15130 [Sphingobium yanoikuyae]
MDALRPEELRLPSAGGSQPPWSPLERLGQFRIGQRLTAQAAERIILSRDKLVLVLDA